MKSIPKLIRRFVGTLILSSFLLFMINFGILATIAMKQAPNGHPWQTAEKAAESLQQTEQGYIMSDEMKAVLNKKNIWAIYIDNITGECIWYFDNLPETIPLKYTASDIASLTRGYIDGYPTFTSEGETGLMVLGFPKDSFWKHMWPSWDYNFITDLPKTVLTILAINACCILIIYVVANTKLLKSVKPITDGIQGLPAGEPITLKETGVLSEISANINCASEILQAQSYQLKRIETARANWIAGVSHDIRTPLSMVMGYASQLKDDNNLTDEEQQKAAVILKQSERMRNLINDLNLASKLEYNMQPINSVKQNMIAIIRQVVVDFINMDINDKYPLEWETDEALTVCLVNADKDLIKRAVNNLIQNCINHNEQGCKIYVGVVSCKDNCTVTVSDDGVGVTDEQIEKLNNAPHYMVCDENLAEQRHGLGLLIVKQIVSAHGGTTIIQHSSYGGFSVMFTLPI